MMETKHEVVSNKTKLFIKRERIRRELIHTKPGETICLNYDQIQLLLTWMKELENRAKEFEERLTKYGFKIN